MRKVFGVFILMLALVAAYYILTYDAGPAEAPTAARAPAAPDSAVGGPEGIHLASWNLLNLGGSKSDEEIAVMADLLRAFDVVAVQEVITSPEGAQAVARLDDALDRTGSQWDYILSDPTSGDGSERYAFLWKPSRVRLIGQPWLEASLATPIDREPYLARFAGRRTGQAILVASFHAVPTAKRPADEIALLDDLQRRYLDDHLLIVGDFNLAESHYAFDELKDLGLQPALVDQKTSLRMRRKNGEHLSQEYDNIFYETVSLRIQSAGVVDFTNRFRTLKEARKISDHLPVHAVVWWN